MKDNILSDYVKNKLKSLLNNSYSPYSNFKVSALIETKDGNMFGGVNVENVSYMYGSCAETTALSKLISSGYKKEDIKKMYIMVDKENPSTPCFLCRQWISEFMNNDSEIICIGNTFKYKVYKVLELCPYKFGGDDLNEAKIN